MNHRFFEVDLLISASMAGLRMGLDAKDKNTSFDMFLTSSSGDLEERTSETTGTSWTVT